MQGVQIAILIIVSVGLLVIAAGILTIRTALQVIHTAVNSNMTRALDEVTQLHKDVTQLIQERNEARVVAGTLSATEDLSKKLITVVSGIAEQQALVAANLRIAQAAVDAVAADLEASHQRAEDVPHDEPAGAAADAASKPSPEER